MDKSNQETNRKSDKMRTLFVQMISDENSIIYTY